MISKISLGTVQFGQDYGIANKKGMVPEKEVFEILDYAQSAGIRYLDTAYAYGVSESVIGKYLRGNPGDFKIVSKLPSLETQNLEQISGCFKESLQRMGIKKLYGYLFHQFTDMSLHNDLYKGMVGLKENGFVENIGFSLYSPDELVLLLDKEINFDLIQFPYSVFDRRFEKYFDVLKKKGVKIQARSVFLQGLVFLDSESLPGRLQEARPQLKKLQQIAKDLKVSIAALCLNFVLCHQQIDQVLVGVDGLTHLKSNIADIGLFDCVRDACDRLKELTIEQEDILLPYKWGVPC